jgi:hypothetical protein
MCGLFPWSPVNGFLCDTLCFSFCRVPQCVLLMVSFVPLCFSRGLTILNFYLENPD